MKNKINIFFYILLFFAVSILVYRLFDNNQQILDMRTKDENPAETIIFNGPNRLKAGNGKFKEGFYDITAKNNIETNSFVLKEGQTIRNVIFYKDNILESNMNISFELKRSEFLPIEFIGGTATLQNTTGSFKVGQELQEGTYRVVVHAQNIDSAFYLQIQDEHLNELEGTTIKGGSHIDIALENNMYFNIRNMDSELGDFTIEILVI